MWNEFSVRAIEDGDVAYLLLNVALNDWMDCIYMVDTRDTKTASDVIKKTMEWWWNEDVVAPYNVEIERALENANIAFTAFYQQNINI